ncbi:BrnA antitoxin family protein [Marinobacter segnicrescens]|uniref:BrnA antitoxin family protein n=1 Tax=Marinobacter segnicrescens TaxID=430453 RepID=UPI003A90541A
MLFLAFVAESYGNQATLTALSQVSREVPVVGRPKAAVTKERITIRLSLEAVAEFRATGSGWQTRIDKALQEYLNTQY